MVSSFVFAAIVNSSFSFLSHLSLSSGMEDNKTSLKLMFRKMLLLQQVHNMITLFPHMRVGLGVCTPSSCEGGSANIVHPCRTAIKTLIRGNFEALDFF